MKSPDSLAAPEFSEALSNFIASGQRVLDLLVQSGDIADEDTTVEVTPHSSTRILYARTRTGRASQEGCGRAGSAKHIAAVQSVERAHKVRQITEVIDSIRAIAACDGWANIPDPPQRPALSIDQTEFVPPGKT